MSAPVIAAEFNLNQMLLIQKLLNVSAYPIVLEIMPQLAYAEESERKILEEQALEELTDMGVCSGGQLTDPTIAQWIRVLRRPDIELAARIWREKERMGISVCRRGPLHVVAMRFQDLITIQALDQRAEITDIGPVAAPILAALGDAAPAQFEPVNILATVGAEIDQKVSEGADFYTELRDAGVEADSARFLTSVLSEADQVWRSEIVAIEHTPGRQELSRAGVGVFDTPRGRITAAPSLALDGRLWSTFAPGTSAHLVKCVGEITQMLPSGGWFEAYRA